MGGRIPHHKRDAVRALVVRVRVERGSVAQKEIDADPVGRGVHGLAFPVGHIGGCAEDGGGAADGRVFVRAGTGVSVSEGGGVFCWEKGRGERVRGGRYH